MNFIIAEDHHFAFSEISNSKKDLKTVQNIYKSNFINYKQMKIKKGDFYNKEA